MAMSGGSRKRGTRVATSSAALASVAVVACVAVLADGRSAVSQHVVERETASVTTAERARHAVLRDGPVPEEARLRGEPDDRAQVLAVMEGYLGFEFDERSNGYGPSLERIERFTAGALRQRSLETLQTRRDLGALLQGRVTVRVESLGVAGDTAAMVVCYRDRTAAYFEDGSPADGTDSSAILVGLSFSRSSAGWAVVERYAGGRIPCDV
jgi:hypothetical protein